MTAFVGLNSLLPLRVSSLKQQGVEEAGCRFCGNAASLIQTKIDGDEEKIEKGTDPRQENRIFLLNCLFVTMPVGHLLHSRITCGVGNEISS